MDERRMLEKLSAERPPLPGGLDQRVAVRLAEVTEAAQPRPSKRGRRLRIALALALLCTAAALALTQSGLLGFRLGYMRADHYFTLPGAQQLVHRLEARAQFPGWQAELKELLYDGRWLQLLFAIRDEAKEQPFTLEERQKIENGDTDAFYALMRAADAYPSTETSGSLLINGQQVNIHSSSLSVGTAPGEYLLLVESALEPTAAAEEDLPLRLAGAAEISLPFTNSQGVQVAALSGRFDAGDAAHRYQLALPEVASGPGFDIVFDDLFASPATVVLAYRQYTPAVEGEDAAQSLPLVQPVDAGNQPLARLKDAGQQSSRMEDGRILTRVRLSYTPVAAQAFQLRLPDGQLIAVRRP